MEKLTVILNKIEKAKELDFGAILGQSIELFKKVWVQGMLLILISVAIMIPLYLMIYIPIIFFGIIDPNSLDPDNINGSDGAMALVLGIIVILLMLCMVSCFIVVVFGLQTAFYRICKVKDFNEAESDDYFYYLKKGHFKKTAVLALATMGIYLLAAALCYLPVFYVIVPLSFVSVIHAFNPELSVSNIVNLSFKLGNKKWLITFGLMFVSGIIANFGLFLCIVGVIATVSINMIPQYFIYKEVIGFGDENEVDKIGVAEE
ncbi:MAG: hypothetical protein ACK5MZ_03780 [Aestuariibaculum sp.]